MGRVRPAGPVSRAGAVLVSVPSPASPMSPRNVLKPARARLSVAEAEERNAPNSLYSPLDPLGELLPLADAPAWLSAAEVAPSVITVTGPEAVTPPPAVEPFRGPATEGVTAAPATATDLSAPPGDLLAADILWDPAAVPVEAVWEQLWSVLEEGGVLRKVKRK